MRSTVRTMLVLASAVALVSAVSEAQGALVTWDVDSAASFVRLNIPDQAINLDGTNATARIRNNQNTSTWSDAGGRRAFLDGTIATQLGAGVSNVKFLQGDHSLVALESGNFRPNPAAYDTNVTNADNPDGTYVNTSGAPAALAGRVRASVSILTVDVALIAFRNVVLDIASGKVALTAGVLAGSKSDFGIETSTLDVDGLSALIVGQVIPDLANVPVDGLLGLNTSGGNIVDIGGGIWRLTYNVTVPLIIDFEGVPLTASVTGQVVAYSNAVPEPSTMVMAGFAAFGLCWAGRRRFRRR